MSTDQDGTTPSQPESQGSYPPVPQPMYAQPQQVFVQAAAPGNGLGSQGSSRASSA